MTTTSGAAGDEERPEEPATARDGPPLQPVGKIHPQPWMTAPETQAVLDALVADGAEVRFIGGCVRDAVLKRPVRDIDIALAEPPGRVMALLRRAGIKVIPTGIDHGTVTAVVGAQCFEITTLRVDVETFGRRARVAFTDDWVADAARRDFTFNALSCTAARRRLRLLRRAGGSRPRPGPLRRRCVGAHRRGRAAAAALLPLLRPLRPAAARRGGACRLPCVGGQGADAVGRTGARGDFPDA